MILGSATLNTFTWLALLYSLITEYISRKVCIGFYEGMMSVRDSSKNGKTTCSESVTMAV